MLTVDFTSKAIADYEKEHGSIYNAVGYSTYLAREFFKVATGHFEEDKELYDSFDFYRKEKGGIIPLADWLMDLCEDGGFFTGRTAQECKDYLKSRMEREKKLSMLTEEEKAQEAAKLVIQKLNAGIKSSSDIL